MSYSERTIARLRSELGWTFTTARYCQAIRDANKEKRVVWVNKCLEAEERFGDVIFTDECTVQLESHRRKSFRKKNTPWKLKYRHKHPPKIHVWARILKRGTTQLVMFGGIMTATRYGDILSTSLIPFLRNHTQTAIDCIKIMTQSIQVGIYGTFCEEQNNMVEEPGGKP